MKVKKITALLIAGVMMTSVLTGCGINKDATVATVGDQKVTMGLVNFMCRFRQAATDDSYRMYFGDNVWNQDMGTGSTMQDSVKQSVVDQIHEYYTMQAHMEEYGISLSDEEKQKITEVAAAFISANSQTALNEMGATQQIVEEMLTLATIQDKMKDTICAKADTNISDEEANMRAYTMLEVRLDGEYDENNSYVEFSDDKKKELKDKASKVSELVADGTKLEKAAEEQGFTTTTGTYDADDTKLDEEVKNALDQLKKGQNSQLIETEDALYIVRIDQETDKEATEKNKESILKERQNDLYNETLEGWQKDDGWKVKEGKLDDIQFKNFFTQNNGQTDDAAEEVSTTDTTESAE